MNSENAIEVRHVTKTFKVYLDKGRTLKEKILFQNRRQHEKRTVLNNISFNVRKGEAIGLIGQNGCGKSTTLKLLTRIMYPDLGTIEMTGRVSSLIELGAGFHPDMSGKQNIYINASIFGLTRKEIDARLDDIIAFSELEDFIDNPVRTYSSGMYMRLAFSVAINVNADILLIDEILAVGDANFQAKCFNKLFELKKSGITIAIVAHDMSSVERLCDRAIWIKDGLIVMDGTPRDVTFHYLDNVLGRGQEKQDIKSDAIAPDIITNEALHHKRWGSKKIFIEKVMLFDQEKNYITCFKTGETISFYVKYKNQSTTEPFTIGIGITRSDGVKVYGTNTMIDGLSQKCIPQEEGEILFQIPQSFILPGTYYLDIALVEENGEALDYWQEALLFQVYSSKRDEGMVRIPHKWYFNGTELK